MYVIVVILSTSLLLLPSVYSAPQEDQITSLPGLLSPPRFNQYSGYLNGTDGVLLHYWFVESELDPKRAPVLLWLTGGPGCSSLYALLTEHGPFRVNLDAKTLTYNPYSWNKVANVIYLESPAGTGFSYSASENYTTDDNITASNNLEALIHFFTKFPEYRSNDFYISGESYGGIYVPTLSVLVADNLPSIKFKGLLVGNGYHSKRLNANAAILFSRGHALFEEKVMVEILAHCCNATTPIRCDFYAPTDPSCVSAITKASSEVGSAGINPYGIFSKCEQSPGGLSHNFLSEVFRPFDFQPGVGRFYLTPPCVNPVRVQKWLNQPKVRSALHVPLQAPTWDVCSDVVTKSYRVLYDSMDWHYKKLLGKVKALVYHGDTDLVCSFLSGEWFVSSLGRQVVTEYSKWTYENQTAGFFKAFADITYATVLGAGHMAPADKPGATFKLVSNFMYNKPIY